MFSDQPYAYPRGNSAESAQENISSINYVAGSRQTGGPMPDLRTAYFTDVQSTAPTVYAEIQEIQQPLMGRKCVCESFAGGNISSDGRMFFFSLPRYASKDRRPLDPPPVVRLRVFEVVVPSPESPYPVREITRYVWLSLSFQPFF